MKPCYTKRYKGGFTMDISSIMNRDLAELQSTVQLSLLNRTMTEQAATAVEMVQEMMPAQHPTLGQSIDLKA